MGPILAAVLAVFVLVGALGYACGFGVSKLIDRIAESIR